jgi:hypothetical protein
MQGPASGQDLIVKGQHSTKQRDPQGNWPLEDPGDCLSLSGKGLLEELAVMLQSPSAVLQAPKVVHRDLAEVEPSSLAWLSQVTAQRQQVGKERRTRTRGCGDPTDVM